MRYDASVYAAMRAAMLVDHAAATAQRRLIVGCYNIMARAGAPECARRGAEVLSGVTARVSAMLLIDMSVERAPSF